METFEYIAMPGASQPVERSMSLSRLLTQSRGAGRGSMIPGPSSSYNQVAAVYGCVKARAEALAALPLMISTASDQIIESGPLADLAARPNPKMTQRSFWRNTEAMLNLFGRVHWHFMFDAGRRPIAAMPINPLQMTPDIDRRNGALRGWMFRPVGAAAALEFMPVEDVHTIIDPDFEDVNRPYEGLSPRRVAARAISQYWKADIANEASLDNGVEPGGYFASNGPISEEQRRDFRSAIDERYAGFYNRRRFMLLENMEFKPVETSYADMEFSDLKKMSRTDICAAYGVPPAVIGYYEDSNYAHAHAAEEIFWINTVMPRGAWLSEEWDLAITSRYEGDRSLSMTEARTVIMSQRELSCPTMRRAKAANRRSGRRFFSWFDTSAIPAVQRAQFAQAEQAKTWIEKGVPVNAVIQAFDLPFPELPWGDTWYKPIGMVDVREDEYPGASDPDGSEDTQTAVAGLYPAQDGPGSPGGRRRDGSGGRGGSGGSSGGGRPTERRELTEQAVTVLWTKWRASWSGLERAARGKVKRHFHELRTLLLARVAELVPATAGKALGLMERRDILGQILIDLAEVNGKLIAKLSPLLRESIRLGGEQSMDEAAQAKGSDKPDVFNISDPEAAAAFRRRQIRIADMNRRTERRLRERIGQAIDEGKSTSELQELIRSEFSMSGARAATIARTEIGAAVEEARQIGREQAAVPLKSWLWSRKESGRPAHAATEQATMENPIPNDQDFTIVGTGATCKQPRGTGRPEEDINCGCTTIARYPGDSVKSVLSRYLTRGFLTYEQLAARDARTGSGAAGNEAHS